MLLMYKDISSISYDSSSKKRMNGNFRKYVVYSSSSKIYNLFLIFKIGRYKNGEGYDTQETTFSYFSLHCY